MSISTQPASTLSGSLTPAPTIRLHPVVSLSSSSSPSYSSLSAWLSAPFTTYDSFVRDQSTWYLPALEAMRTMTIFLPGRFDATDVRSETIYTVLNVLTAYHDHILHRPRKISSSIAVENPSAAVRRAQHLLTFCHYTCVFVEMAGKRLVTSPYSYPPSVKWLLISLVEALRVYSRLRILYHNEGRMLTPPTNEQFQLEAIEGMVNEERKKIIANLSSSSCTSSSSSPSTDLVASPSSALVPSLSTSSSSSSSSSSTATPSSPPLKIPDYLSQCNDLIDMYLGHARIEAVSPHGLYHSSQPPAHPRELSGYRPHRVQVLAEILFIVRPLVYTMGRVFYEDESLFPWLTSLIIDVVSRINLDNFESMGPNQRAEASRRLVMLTLYAFRTPFFEQFTKGPLISASELIAKVPIAGFILKLFFDIALQLQGFYFYTSAS